MRFAAKVVAIVLAFALRMALPLVSSAGSITSVFAGSTTGTTTIFVGNTISFDVYLTLDAGVTYNGMSFSVTGDEVGGLASNAGIGWAGVANQVTNWSWNFSTIVSTQVDFTGVFGFASPLVNPSAPPTPGLIGQVALGAFSGLGNSVLVGTVTIVADTAGTFGGGAIMHNQYDTGSWQTAAGADLVSFTTSSFSVLVPEPGTALLIVLGLAGLGVMGRSIEHGRLCLRFGKRLRV